jgi:diguanylate cyclase (GGDEF)-like protein
MIALFVVLGVGNFLVGFALAVAYDRWLRPAYELTDVRETATAAGHNSSSAEAPREVSESDQELPANWLTSVQASGLIDTPPLETVLWVLLRQTDEVRQNFTTLDHGPHDESAGDLDRSVWERLLRSQRHWSEQIRRSVRWFRATESGECGQRLPPLLEDFAARTDELVAQVEAPGHDSPRVHLQRDMVTRMLETTYRLRDELEEWLAAELVRTARASSIPASLRVDADAGLYNRLGLEYVAECLDKEQVAETGDTCLAVVEIDRFQRVNQRLGAQRSDALIHAFSRTVENALRHNRGFDRAARVGGPGFVLFLGGTTLAGAEVVCERLRQAVEATSFRVANEELELTVSCGVAVTTTEESIAEGLVRARTALAEARKSGRNRTAIHDGVETQVVKHRQYQVTGQIIDVPLPESVAAG